MFLFSLGRRKRVGPWEDPETQFPHLPSGFNPWQLQELVFKRVVETTKDAKPRCDEQSGGEAEAGRSAF